MTKKILSMLSLVALISCQQGREHSSNETKPKANFAISERVQQYDQFLSLIELKEKPLFQVQYENKARGDVDAGQKVKILREQNEMIRKLQNISPEIKVIYRYQKVLNALAVVVPRAYEDAVEKLQGAEFVEREGQFNPIDAVMAELDPFEVAGDPAGNQGAPTLATKNSTSFIGALKAQAMGIDGEKIKVGVIDTGIDYLHKMLGGPGTKEAYDAQVLSQSNVFFPNDKVVGGIDLVGEKYDPGSPIFANTIPQPDGNPMDEGGHGTHVAGSVAGIGDGVNTYNGVAPEADLYAIKVFGAGSVGDSVVIKALEYAADPNGDFDLSDQLDVVNLSLGSSYGGAHLLYRKAIRNLALAGTVVVASAGNSGHIPYITGSPGSTEEAISVAASIDDMDHNIKKMASVFETTSNPEYKVVVEEGEITKALKDTGDVTGVLVDAGFADADFDQNLKDALKGNIALISRGNVSFVEKLTRAFDAGAIAAVVYNNSAGDPIVMGGDSNVDIPGVMISQEAGTFILSEMATAPVTATLSENLFIQNLKLIDTLTGFSSRGPRIGDALLKPEISAPGFNIISAALGSGDQATRMSGTSMSAPHMAGVMALMKQKAKTIEAKLGRPLSNEEFKSIVMNHTRRISDADGKEYPVSQQGAGRVQIHKSVLAEVIATPSSYSLGQHFLSQPISIEKKLTVLNLSEANDMDLKVSFEGHKAIELISFGGIQVSSLDEATINLEFEIDPNKLSEYHNEMDGFVQILDKDQVIAHIPVLMIGTKVAGLEIGNIAGDTKSVEISLTNFNDQGGKAMAFNLIGTDDKVVQDRFFSFGAETGCDLKSAGYRITEESPAVTPTETSSDATEPKPARILEIAYELHDSRNSFQPCELLLLIDSDEDDIPDFELIGAMASNMGLPGSAFTSMLFDAKKMRQARKAYEQSHIKDLPVKLESPNFSSALVDANAMDVFTNSSVAVLRFPLEKLGLPDEIEELNVKVLIDRNNARNSERDDYLGNHFMAWEALKLKPEALPIKSSTDVEIDFAGTMLMSLERGQSATGKYLVLMPHNSPGTRSFVGDVK